jgi:hypothetical protein
MSSAQSTETRGEWLWRKLGAIFGTKFLDMWGCVDARDVQAEWTNALRGISREALQRGVAACYHMRAVPTLPEFLDACSPPPAMYRPAAAALTDDSTRTPSHEARAQLAQIAKRIGMREPGIAWARRTVDDAQSGRVLPGNRLQVAIDALSTWEATHGVMRGREPGCDDEDIVARATMSPEEQE